MSKTYKDFVKELLPEVKELFPWDLRDLLDGEDGKNLLIVDIREPYEFDAMKIENSINVPRGILEAACEWDYEETVPELVNARERKIIVICRSGNRSVMAAHVMQLMGYKDVVSLKTGLRGWNDSEEPLVDKSGNSVDIDKADEYFNAPVSEEKRAPK